MSPKNDNVVRFGDLESGTYAYRFALGDAFFQGCENDELKGGNVEVEAQMQKRGHGLEFRFRLKGEVATWCDRCLGDMRLPIEGEERLEVRFSDTETSDEEDVAVLPEGAGEIDLSEWFYEYVAVRLPLQHIHAEGECDAETLACMAGGETGQGQQDGKPCDPRWEALEKLK